MSGGGVFKVVNYRPGDAKDERQERQEHGEPCHSGERHDEASLRHVVLRQRDIL